MEKLIMLVAVLFGTILASKSRLPLHKVSRSDRVLPSTYEDFLEANEYHLDSKKGFAYVVNMSIGTPPQQFQFMLDSGSADPWVFGPTSRGPSSAVPVDRFNETASTTFRKQEGEWSIQYGKGSVSGSLGIDNFFLGDIKVSDVTFGLSQSLQGEANDEDGFFDGIIGLAFKPAAKTKSDTLPELLMASNQNLSAISFFFATNNETEDYIVLGEHDIEPNQRILYTPRSEEGHKTGMWFLTLDDVRLGDLKDDECSDKSDKCQVIPDTGTSLVVIPPLMFLSFFRMINAARPDCTVPFLPFPPTGPIVCSEKTMEKLPDFKFSFGGHEYVMKPEHYVVKFDKSFVIGVQTLILFDTSKQLYILGDNFLRVYPSIFSYKDNGVYGAVVTDSCGNGTVSYNNVALSKIIAENTMFVGCAMSDYRLSISCSKSQSNCKSSSFSGTKNEIHTSLDAKFSSVAHKATVTGQNHCSQLDVVVVDDKGEETTLSVSVSCASKSPNPTNPDSDSPKKNPTTPWMWIGVSVIAALAVIGIIVVVLRKKKSASDSALLGDASRPSVNAP
jgi:hypothetical protein